MQLIGQVMIVSLVIQATSHKIYELWPHHEHVNERELDAPVRSL